MKPYISDRYKRILSACSCPETSVGTGKVTANTHNRDCCACPQDLATGKKVTLSFTDEDRPGYFAAVNDNFELAEVGWLKFPKLMHIGWAAQWLQYEAELRTNLSEPALVVPVFEEQVSTILQYPSLSSGPDGSVYPFVANVEVLKLL